MCGAHFRDFELGEVNNDPTFAWSLLWMGFGAWWFKGQLRQPVTYAISSGSANSGGGGLVGVVSTAWASARAAKARAA